MHLSADGMFVYSCLHLFSPAARIPPSLPPSPIFHTFSFLSLLLLSSPILPPSSFPPKPGRSQELISPPLHSSLPPSKSISPLPQMLWVDLIQDTLGALALATEPVGRSQELISPALLHSTPSSYSPDVMLWVDLIQDTLGALALATEPPSDKLLEQPPVGRSQELVSAAMWRSIIGQTVYQLSLLCVLWFKGIELLQLPGPPGVPRVIANGGMEISEGEKQLVTIVFSSFVFMQVGWGHHKVVYVLVC
ncbi:unnamed protein product [Closterium sp. Naga37s-1]|nr:unnamed protein product [Closterium sp. Naga37s-1]